MKAHRPEMLAAWAKEYGISGYEMYDPKYRNDQRNKVNKRQERRKGKNEQQKIN